MGSDSTAGVNIKVINVLKPSPHTIETARFDHQSTTLLPMTISLEMMSTLMPIARGNKPKIVVLGLNPHAGENGLFGMEEQSTIIPAIEAAKKIGLNVEGPVSPDTAFLPTKRQETDLFVCMYHDQGHIPLKSLCFETGDITVRWC